LFCGYDLGSGKRGQIAAPPAGAARAARIEGVRQLALGVPALIGATALLLLPLTIFRMLAIVALPAAGGLCARGLSSLAQAKRYDKKQRLFEESTAAMLPASASESSSIAIPTTRR
jgi:hypothetical protein